MGKGRLEAFSDGVLAIIITIMVLEMKAPVHGASLADLEPVWPVFLSYVLSFVYLGIYWNNHHHMLHATRRVSGAVLWANLHLLFWLSLFPFTTAWMGENGFAAAPMAVYGVVLLCAAVAYWVLQQCILRVPENRAVLQRAIGLDVKGKVSPLMYALGIAGSFASAWIAGAFYVGVAAMWIVPDRRIERALAEGDGAETREPRP